MNFFILMRMTPFERKILQILVYSPDKLLPLLKRIGNVNYAYSTMKKFMPQRVGIEIEGWGACKREITNTAFHWKMMVYIFQWFEEIKSNFDFDYGIHIHIDAGEFFENIQPKDFPMDLLDFLWNDVFKYKGKFNAKVVTYNKTAVRYHEEYKSIEYRIIPMCQTWEQFIKYILVCQYCNHVVKHKLNWNKQHILDILGI